MAKNDDRQSKSQSNRSRAAAQKQRESVVRWIGVGAIAALVVGVIVIGFVGTGGNDKPSNTTKDQLTLGGYPTNGFSESNLSWSPNPDSKAASTLVIWEDFQCPACRQFEYLNGTSVEKLAADDVVKVEYRMTAFLDNNFPESDYSSHRAINAFGCAVDAGVGQKFHDLIYINQPEKEGTGFTDETLVNFAKSAGEKDLGAFSNCVYGRSFMKWGSDSTQMFFDEGIPGTPHVLLDGKEPTTDDLKSNETFLAWVNANKK